MTYKGYSYIRNRGRSGLQITNTFLDIILLTDKEYNCKVERIQKTFRKIIRSDLSLLKQLNMKVRKI